MFMCPKCGKMLEDGMRFCDNCGAQILETAVCPNCGEQIIPGYAFCQKCGAPISQAPAPDPNAGYAPNPGAGYAPTPGYTPDPGAGYAPTPRAGYTAPSDPGAGYTPNYNPDPGFAGAAPQQKKPIPKKAIMFGGIGVAAVVVIIALVAIISSLAGGGGKSDGKTHMFYLRDGEIVYYDLRRGEQTEVTSRLSGSSLSNYQLANIAGGLGWYIALSEDGTKLFYPDRNDFSKSNGVMQVTLYYRDMKKPNDEPLKIDSDISYYAINKAGTVIIYLKGSDGNLYHHDLTNKEKIAGGVAGFRVADDCKKLLYLTEDGAVYLWSADGEKTKIASDITNLYYVSEDLSTIYYTKDDGLYKQSDGSEGRVKIASDVSRIVTIYETGELYYIKSEEVEFSLLEYVNDDMAAADAAITKQPEKSDFPYPEGNRPKNISWSNNYATTGDYPKDEYPYYYIDKEKSELDNGRVYVTGMAEREALDAQVKSAQEKYDTEYNRADAEYKQATTAYNDKTKRDNRREYLSNNTVTRTDYTLYYFNGTESTAVTDALASYWIGTYSTGSPVLLAPVYERDEVRKPKLSELMELTQSKSATQVREMIEEARYSKTEQYFVVQGTTSLFDEPDAKNFTISPDGDTVYFLNDLSDDGREGDLYKLAISDGKIGRAELYDTGVSSDYMYFMSDGRFAYYKDVDNAKGDFYIDKVQIDYDVRLAGASYLKDKDAVLYYTDWNSDKNYGTLKMYTEKEKTKIADDVHSFTVTDDGDILYLNDYSSSSYKGTLYSYNKGKPEKIDDDVMALLPVSSIGMRGGYYFYYNW